MEDTNQDTNQDTNNEPIWHDVADVNDVAKKKAEAMYKIFKRIGIFELFIGFIASRREPDWNKNFNNIFKPDPKNNNKTLNSFIDFLQAKKKNEEIKLNDEEIKLNDEEIKLVIETFNRLLKKYNRKAPYFNYIWNVIFDEIKEIKPTNWAEIAYNYKKEDRIFPSQFIKYFENLYKDNNLNGGKKLRKKTKRHSKKHSKKRLSKSSKNKRV
jgi:hypothetical protein